MSIIITLLALIFLIGMIIGSFLNVVILRSLTNESIIFPASKCPKCQTPLKWYHNIPVFSYLFLKGKCAFCNEKISIQYPIVEFLTGCIFVLTSYYYLRSSLEWGFIDGFDFKTISFWIYTLIVSCFYIVIAGTDIKELTVFEKHTYLLTGVGLVFGLIQSIYNSAFSIFLFSVLGGVIFFLFMQGLKILFDRVLKTTAIGDGDPFIAGAIGTVIGAILPAGTDFWILIYAIIAIFLLAPLLYAVWTVPTYLYTLYKENNYKLMSAIIIFFMYVFAYFFANQVGMINNNVIQICSFVIAVILGITVCVGLLKTIREKKSSLCAQIPLGPALVLSGYIMMLAIPEIVNYLSILYS